MLYPAANMKPMSRVYAMAVSDEKVGFITVSNGGTVYLRGEPDAKLVEDVPEEKEEEEEKQEETKIVGTLRVANGESVLVKVTREVPLESSSSSSSSSSDEPKSNVTGKTKTETIWKPAFLLGASAAKISEDDPAVAAAKEAERAEKKAQRAAERAAAKKAAGGKGATEEDEDDDDETCMVLWEEEEEEEEVLVADVRSKYDAEKKHRIEISSVTRE